LSTYNIGLIKGDGIGPEVIDEALKVLSAAGFSFKTTDFELGAAHYIKTGEVLYDSTLEELKNMDAILLGAIGPPVGSNEVPSGLLERGLLLNLRFSLDLYINLRPFYGTNKSIAPEADFVIVRENTEGPYVGEGGVLRKGTGQEVATQGSINTRYGVERTVRFAFELARRRSKKLTLVHKTNVLTYAGDLWSRTFNEVSKEYPEIKTDYNHVDAACIYLVENPYKYDVIVTDNLFGDITTDLAGAVTGGIGYAASANLNPEKKFPSIFEPVHGAAHDIAGSGKANPLAAILSASMMLEHLGEKDLAYKVKSAVRHELNSDFKEYSTKEIGDKIAERIVKCL
jgi:3-isopropylmalate dehydrogenase